MALDGNKMVNIKVVNDSGFPLPEYAHLFDAGMDVRAAITEPLTLRPLSRSVVPTGLKMAIPPGYEIQVRPRSGWAAKNGVTVCNSPGCCDAGYRGIIGVILINLGEAPVVIQPGDRIAQLVLKKVEMINWIEVDSLDETERGEGGFCSTGIK